MDCRELAPGPSRVGLALQYRKDRLTSPLVIIIARKHYCTITLLYYSPLAMCDGIIDNFWKVNSREIFVKLSINTQIHRYFPKSIDEKIKVVRVVKVIRLLSIVS